LTIHSWKCYFPPREIKLILALIIASLCTTACTTKVPDQPQGWQPYPSAMPAETGLPAVRPKTKVLTKFASSSITSMSTDGTITIKANKVIPVRAVGELSSMKTDEPDKLEVGEIIVSAPAPEVPNGFMQKISDITYDANGDAIIKTTQATLVEVIAGSDLTPEQLKSKTVSVPVEMMLQRTTRGGQPRWEILPYDSGLQCVGSPQNFAGGFVTAQACVRVAFWIDVRIDIGWWWIFPYLSGFGSSANGMAEVLASVKAGATASVGAGASMPINQTIKLADLNSSATMQTSAAPIVFWLGPIPVVITPRLALSLGVRGNLFLNASASVGIRSTIPDFWVPLGTKNNPVSFGFYCTTGVSCNAINTFKESMDVASYLFSNWQIPSNPIQLNASASLGAYAALQAFVDLSAGVYLYGVAGLSAGVTGYVGPEVSFSASVSASSNLSSFELNPVQTRLSAGIYAGLDGYLDAGVDILGYSFGTRLLGGAIIPRTFLGGIAPMCWTGATRQPTCQ
jgi:hypothetical protein